MGTVTKASDIRAFPSCSTFQTQIYFGRDLLTVSSGTGQSMQQIIVGRIVGGAGAAGMVSLVSILISGEHNESLSILEFTQ